jgi:probable addiction module antidote protein
MTRTKTRPFDVAEHLDSPETIAAYLNEAFETGDISFMLAALRDVARARGMTAVAKQTGFAREALYRALNKDGNPEFATIMSVIAAFGLRLNVHPHDGKRGS